MKASEIMVGDLLKYTTPPYIQVASITMKKIGYHIRPNDPRIHYVRLCEVNPIPLTPEVLEKNGFEEYDGAYIFYTAHYDDCVNWCGTILKIGCDNGYMELADVQYVHELQHCLRMCNINKTIKL